MANQKLPGVGITIRDGNLVFVEDTPTTEKLMIIGTALDGPSNVPIRVSSPGEAEAIFGPLKYSGDYLDPITSTASNRYADNSLVMAFYEAILGGAGYVTLVRAGGTKATTASTFSASLLMTARNAGRLYNSVQVVASSGASGYNIAIVQPTGKGGTVNFSVLSTFSLRELCDTLNSDNRNQTVDFAVQPAVELNTVATITPGTATFTGGTNGTRAPGEDYATGVENYYTALTQTDGTFDMLADQNFNVCLLTGVWADDAVVAATTTTSVVQRFAQFIYTVGKEAYPGHGVIGLRPTGLRVVSDLNTYASASLLNVSSGWYKQTSKWMKFGYFMNAGFSYADPDTNETVDIGRCVSVVAGPDVVLQHTDRGLYYTNGAAVYAGAITAMAPQRAMTNKPLGMTRAIGGSFNKNTHELLNQGVGRDLQSRFMGGGAYVTFKVDSVTATPIIIADNTASMRVSDFKALQVERIVHFAVQLVKNTLSPYIGEPSTPEAQNAMRTQVTSALNKVAEMGCLIGGENIGWQVSIGIESADRTFTRVKVGLRLRPAFQIRWIDVDASVTN